MISIGNSHELFQFAERFHQDPFYKALKQIQSMSDNELDVFLLQTEFLSNDLIMYLNLTRPDYLKTKIIPLIDKRSESVFDLYFSTGVTEKQIASAWDQWLAGRTKLNGLELSLLIIMRARYNNVDQALELLSQSECLERRQEVLLNLEQQQFDQEGQDEPFQQMQQDEYLNQEYFSEKLFYKNSSIEFVPFNSFWYNFILWSIQKQPIKPYTLIENIVIGSHQQSRLSICAYLFTEQINFTISQEDKLQKLHIDSHITMQQLVVNQQSELMIKASIIAEVAGQIILKISLSGDIYNDDLQQEILHHITIFSGQNQIDITEKVILFSDSYNKNDIKIEIIQTQKSTLLEYDIIVPIENLQNIYTCEAQYRYLKNCDENQFKLQLDLFKTNIRLLHLLKNKEFSIFIISQANQRKIKSELLFYLIGLAQNDCNFIQKYINSSIKLKPVSNQQFLFKGKQLTVQAAAIDLNTFSPQEINFTETSLKPQNLHLFISLLGKRLTVELTVAEKVVLAQLFIIQGKLEIAKQILSKVDSIQAKLIILYIENSRFDNSQEIQQFLDSNEEFLLDENVLLMKRLIKPFKEDEFTVTRKDNLLTFNRSPVILNFFSIPWNGSPNLNQIPGKSVQIDCNQYTLEKGNYVVQAIYQFEKVQITVNNSDFDIKVDLFNQILHVSGEKVYVRFMQYDQFLADSFTDFDGNVLIPQGASSYVVVKENGDFTKSDL